MKIAWGRLYSIAVTCHPLIISERNIILVDNESRFHCAKHLASFYLSNNSFVSRVAAIKPKIVQVKFWWC